MLLGTHLAVGMNSGGIQIWDASRCGKVRDMHPHEGRVGSLAWGPQSSLLASGEFFSFSFFSEALVIVDLIRRRK
jgi:WD40 repeat protein